MLTFFLNVLPRFADAGTSMERFQDDKDVPWQVTANSLSFMEKEGLYVAKGDVAFTKNGQTLYAQEAVYNRGTGVVNVSGNVRFESGEDVLTGESGVFNLKDQTGKITKGRLFLKENHYYISGDLMEKVGQNSYLIKNCRLTTCDGESPVWSITGKEVKVTVEGSGVVKHASLRVHNVPLLYVPYMVFPAKTKRQTGLLPLRMGYSSRNGMDLELPFFWAISDQTDATFYEHYMSNRGLMQGLEYRYIADYDSKGMFMNDILSDRIEDKDLNNPEHLELSPFARTNKIRYWLRSKADQQFPLGLKARLDMDLVSDQDYLKEFRGDLFGFKSRPDISKEFGRPVEEANSPLRRSALRVGHEREDVVVQALAAYNQRPENPSSDDTPQPLAGLDLSILPRPLDELPFSFSLDTDYDYVWRDFGQKGHRLSLSPQLSYPVRFGPYLELEPSVGFTKGVQWLDSDRNNISRQSKDAYLFQTRLSTILERIFGFKWRSVKRLKHKFTPSLTYEYQVHMDEDRFKPWFEPIDEEGSINRVILSLDNLLDARKEGNKGDVSYEQWGAFSLRQGYDIKEAGRDEEPWRKKEPYEPLKGILSFMPYPGLDIDAEAHWDHYANDVSFTDLSLDLSIERSGARTDTYSVDYEYVKGENKNLNYQISIHLSYGFLTGTSLRRDLTLDQNIENSYWVEYLSQCWGVRLTTEKADDTTTFMVTFRLLGLGDVRAR